MTEMWRWEREERYTFWGVEYLDTNSREGGVSISLKGVGLEKGLGCAENSNASI